MRVLSSQAPLGSTPRSSLSVCSGLWDGSQQHPGQWEDGDVTWLRNTWFLRNGGRKTETTRQPRQCNSKSKGLDISGDGLGSLGATGIEPNQKELTGVEKLSCAPPETQSKASCLLFSPPENLGKEHLVTVYPSAQVCSTSSSLCPSSWGLFLTLVGTYFMKQHAAIISWQRVLILRTGPHTDNTLTSNFSKTYSAISKTLLMFLQREKAEEHITGISVDAERIASFSSGKQSAEPSLSIRKEDGACLSQLSTSR